MSLMIERPREYELVLILSPEVDEEDATAAIERIDSFITEHGGNVTDTEPWGIRRLAYPIQRFQEGNYVLSRFTIDAAVAQELDQTLEMAQEVIRHLLTRV